MAEEIGKMAGGSTIGPQGVVAEEIPFMPAELSYFIKMVFVSIPRVSDEGPGFQEEPNDEYEEPDKCAYRDFDGTPCEVLSHSACGVTPYTVEITGGLSFGKRQL